MDKSPFKILVKYATRGRTDRFFGGMDTIYSLAEVPEMIYTIVTADENDPEMNNDFVKTKLRTYPNTEIIYGVSKSKVDAINRDMDILPEQMKDWEILINFSDDQRFVTPKWDTYLRVDFNSISPKFDCYLHYLDPDTKSALSTYLIAGRKYIDRFGFIYDPRFKSLFCDNLADDAAKALGKYYFIGMQLIHHYNPSYGYKDFLPDEMYLEQQKIGWSVDMELYNKIKSEGIENYLKNFSL